MKGKLTEQPLAELVREISSKRLSGTLRLEFERAKTVIYFENGQIVYAASNLRSLRLLEYLGKRKVLPAVELACLNSGVADLALAATLRSTGKLQQQQIQAVLVSVVADVMRVALLWTEGTWDFDERSRLAEKVQVNVDTISLLREAAQRLPLKFVSLRFQNANEVFARSNQTPGMGRVSAGETSILSRLDRPLTLSELTAASRLADSELQPILYGLTLNGFVEREYWRNAFRTEAPKVGKEALDASTSRKAEGGASKEGWAENEDEVDLENFFARLNEANNHYEVIDLPPTANANQIKNAYYALARRYHPDRFHLQSGTSLHSRISSAFARITQAYETLTDANARANYDSTLDRARRYAESNRNSASTDSLITGADVTPSETELGEAEYNFREGTGALQQGRIDAAVSHLATASHLEPTQARYRAHYGRALAAKDTTRRLAEAEIQAAVKLEPGNAIYRTMLAELYFDLRFHRRAQTELDRALAIDPGNPSARALLRKLEKSRKVG